MSSVLLTLHALDGALLLLGALVLTIWAFVLRGRHAGVSPGFWRAARVEVALFGVQILLGLANLAVGPPRTWLHLMYGALVLLGIAVHESFARRARVEPKAGDASVAMFLGFLWLVVFLLLGRAYMTGAFGG